MRIPTSTHPTGPWRIRAIAPDFEVEDVWALPVHGRAEDFDDVVALFASGEPGASDSRAAQFVWWVRDQLGRWLDLGRVSAEGGESEVGALPIPGTRERSLAARLPDDLRGSVADIDVWRGPFVPLDRTDDEFAAEISNRTVHAVLHVAWVEAGQGRYQAQMAVYVKPRGALGRAYMGFIKPFRYAVVYPALMRQLERAWATRGPAVPS